MDGSFLQRSELAHLSDEVVFADISFPIACRPSGQLAHEAMSPMAAETTASRTPTPKRGVLLVP
ncbi:hypothetical protein ACFVW8_38890 [Streptomyces sp. NPDC058221]|uniref:hypothetical protein n=1 Tax=Streptomyces sp. NPDC058221 TaxID=3346388 RepID=UPI0036F01F40